MPYIILKDKDGDLVDLTNTSRVEKLYEVEVWFYVKIKCVEGSIETVTPFRYSDNEVIVRSNGVYIPLSLIEERCKSIAKKNNVTYKELERLVLHEVGVRITPNYELGGDYDKFEVYTYLPLEVSVEPNTEVSVSNDNHTTEVVLPLVKDVKIEVSLVEDYFLCCPKKNIEILYIWSEIPSKRENLNYFTVYDTDNFSITFKYSVTGRLSTRIVCDSEWYGKICEVRKSTTTSVDKGGSTVYFGVEPYRWITEANIENISPPEGSTVLSGDKISGLVVITRPPEEFMRDYPKPRLRIWYKFDYEEFKIGLEKEFDNTNETTFEFKVPEFSYSTNLHLKFEIVDTERYTSWTSREYVYSYSYEPPEQPKPESIELKVDKSEVLEDEEVEFYGTVKPSGTRWKVCVCDSRYCWAHGWSDLDGSFRIRLKLDRGHFPGTGYYEFYARVGEVKSNTVRILVRRKFTEPDKIEITPNKTEIKAGEVVKFTGKCYVPEYPYKFRVQIIVNDDVVKEVDTDDYGNFSFEIKFNQGGDYVVYARVGSVISNKVTVHVEKVPATITINSDKTVVYDGDVVRIYGKVEAYGNPLANRLLRLEVETPEHGWCTITKTRTDSSGNYEFNVRLDSRLTDIYDGLEPNSYWRFRVRVEPELDSSGILSIYVIERPLPKEYGSIEGYVRDIETKNPVINAVVIIEEINYTTRTDVHGYYVLRNIPVGRYKVRAVHEDYEEEVKEVEVEKDTTTRLDFELKKKEKVSVKPPTRRRLIIRPELLGLIGIGAVLLAVGVFYSLYGGGISKEVEGGG